MCRWLLVLKTLALSALDLMQWRRVLSMGRGVDRVFMKNACRGFSLSILANIDRQPFSCSRGGF